MCCRAGSLWARMRLIGCSRLEWGVGVVVISWEIRSGNGLNLYLKKSFEILDRGNMLYYSALPL